MGLSPATLKPLKTRNPDKYNKNAERNRLRDIECERRRIWQEALYQAQRLAAIHDPSGAMFNVKPVITLEGGKVISQGTLRRRQEKEAERGDEEKSIEGDEVSGGPAIRKDMKHPPSADNPTNGATIMVHNAIHPDRLARIEGQPQTSYRSKNQIKKMAKFEPRPPPPKPTIPEYISIPEGEENWLSLWDLDDEQLERRVIRDKKRRAAERKALRAKQQSGKAERRMARDEKRRVYRDVKLEWKAIKEEQTREKTKLKALEDEEAKKVAVDLATVQRDRALACCAALGFTLDNTEGVGDIKPKAIGMKGLEVNIEAIDKGKYRSDIKPKANRKKVDLSSVPKHIDADYILSGQRNVEGQPEFIPFDVGKGQEHKTLSYNHKLRRKLHRAIEYAEIQKELLVRQRALEFCKEKGVGAPAILSTEAKPTSIRGQRILENGTLETARQERVRARRELAEFNTRMRVLRKQAKEVAIYAGLRKHAEVTGRIAPRDLSDVEKEVESESCIHNHIVSNLSPMSDIGKALPKGAKRKHSESE
ncbi:MAG: hypothetical protein Q9217_000318 [Psora testacea]